MTTGSGGRLSTISLLEQWGARSPAPAQLLPQWHASQQVLRQIDYPTSGDHSECWNQWARFGGDLEVVVEDGWARGRTLFDSAALTEYIGRATTDSSLRMKVRLDQDIPSCAFRPFDGYGAFRTNGLLKELCFSQSPTASLSTPVAMPLPLRGTVTFASEALSYLNTNYRIACYAVERKSLFAIIIASGPFATSQLTDLAQRAARDL